ncbi:MAG: HDIG domain-containing protein [Chloroflexi bacterium]|nr:MAG: HDIG domain-containing protein [Chloroflexota bacterium]
MSTYLHRIRQFSRALGASVDPRELLELAEYLDAAQRDLFRRMSTGDQRHSLNLFYRLRAQGETDDALLQAALLHDVGKSLVCIRTWQRVAHVLLGRVAPRRWEHFCLSPKRDWRYAFHVLAHHTELGAELARAAACNDEVIALIRNHQRPPSAPLSLPAPAQRKLRALQAADED